MPVNADAMLFFVFFSPFQAAFSYFWLIFKVQIGDTRTGISATDLLEISDELLYLFL